MESSKYPSDDSIHLAPKGSSPYFWDLPTTEEIAFLTTSGDAFSYRALHHRVSIFKERLDSGKKLLSIICDGHINQYIMYLAGLNAGCPILLTPPGRTSIEDTYPVTYRYYPATDKLSIDTSTVSVPIHPDLALLISTSGTTGAAKCVRLSKYNINSNAKSIAQYLNLQKSDRAPLNLPFSYSYGISVLNSHLSAHAQLCPISGSASEPSFWECYSKMGCTSFAGVPYSYQLLRQAKIKTDELSSLRYMTQAGGKLEPEEVKYWCSRSKDEGWLFYVMYGQTEASPRISYIPPSDAFDNPSCIGIAIPGGRLRVEDETGSLAPNGYTGELVYEGPNVMMGYAYGGDDLALESGPQRLPTGDLAIKHPNGFFELVGRRSRFVKIFGLRIALDEIETFLSKQGIVGAASATGETITIFIQGEKPEQRRAKLLIRDWLKIPEEHLEITSIKALPRQTSGKLDRHRLTELAADRPESDISSASTKATTVVAVFQKYFDSDIFDKKLSFRELGGDSLSYVSLSIELESILGSLPAQWDRKSVEFLESVTPTSSKNVHLELPILLRALAILLIVSTHLEMTILGYAGGGSQLLFFVAGWSLATYILPSVWQSRTVTPIISLIVRVAAPTLIFTGVNDLLSGYGDWPAYLFIGNWISINLPGSAWFVDVYIQELIILGLLLRISSIRDYVEKNTFWKLSCGTVLALALSMAIESIFDTSYLYNRVPHTYLWMILGGSAAALASTTTQRVTGSAIVGLGYYFYTTPLIQSVEDSLMATGVQLFFSVPCFGALALFWIPKVRLPRFVAIAARRLASASLIIYLTHMKVGQIISKGIGSAYPWFELIGALCVGILLWQLYAPADRALGAFVHRSLRDRRSPSAQQ